MEKKTFEVYESKTELLVSRRSKMKSILHFLLVISLIRSCKLFVNEYTTVLDESLQQFREDILSFQHDSYVRLDIAFFTFYTETFEKMNQAITSYHLLEQKFRQSCSKFPWYSLEPYAARRLINICDEVKRFLRKVFPFPDNFIEKVYPNPESLSSQTLFELMAEEYFGKMEKHLEFVAPIYHRSQDCVAPLFATFLNIYKQPIEAMIKLFEEGIPKLFSGIVERYLKAAENCARSLNIISERMKYCSSKHMIDTYGCVSGFVGFDCRKRWTECGPVYMTMVRIRFYLRRIENFHSRYQRLVDEIVEVVKVTDGQLLLWSNGLDKCLNNVNTTSL